MIALDQHPSGRHFLQIPGPSPVPDRILRAISLPTIDHRGPEFALLGKRVIAGMQRIFQTRHPVVIYAASGTGAWEAALVNLMSQATPCCCSRPATSHRSGIGLPCVSALRPSS